MSGDAYDPVLASDAERERVVDALRAGSTEGRLRVDELEGRTARALSARTRGELVALTTDLPSRSDVRQGPAPERSRRRVPAQLAPYLAVNLLLIVIWAASGADYFWPLWPMLGWGLGILIHGRPGHGRPRPPTHHVCAPRHRRI